MNNTFKFRYVNEIVGFLVLVCVGVVIALVLFAGRAQGWFIRDVEIFTEFPAEGAFGLVEGSEVQLLQTTVGSVQRIEPTEDGRIRGMLKIRGDFLQYVREDSVAVVRKKLGFGGDTLIEITRGTGPALSGDQLFIPSRQDNDLLEKVEANVEELKAAILPTVNQLRILLREYTLLAADLRDEEGPLMPILMDVQKIVSSVEQGEGAVGQLLTDPETAENLDTLLLKVNAAMDSFNLILQDIAEATKGIPETSVTVQGQIEKMPELIAQGQATLQEAEILIAGLKEHWLIRKYIEQEATQQWLSPDRVSGATQGDVNRLGAGTE